MFRGRTIRILALEALGIAAALAVAGTIIYFHGKPKPVHVLRRLAGLEQNVSRSDRVQYAPALAASPRDPHVLLGGSSDSLSDTRIYTSQDGGRSWTSTPGPPLLRGNCDLDHPAVAITASGREVFVFGASTFCDLPTPKIRVAVRVGTARRWRIRSLFPVKGYARDDHFAVATLGRRVWVAWARRIHRFSSTWVGYLVVSADDGRTWSQPRALPVPQPFALSLAVSRQGRLFAAVADGDDDALVLLASRDGGRTFVRKTLAQFASPYDESCEGALLPPQSRFCISPSPRVAVTREDGVVVGWSDVERNGSDGLRFARLTPSLRLVGRIGRIGPVDRQLSDQFLPSLAVDRSTIWACYMDTDGDPYRRRAWPTCTLSRDDGRTWSVPVRVARPYSDETQTAANLRGYGSTAVVAADGVANVMWTDTRNILRDGEDIYAARVLERSMRR